MINLPIPKFSKSFKTKYVAQLISYMNNAKRKDTVDKLKTYCSNNGMDFENFIHDIATEPFPLPDSIQFSFLKKYYDLMILRYKAEQLVDNKKIELEISKYLKNNNIQNNDFFHISTQTNNRAIKLCKSIDSTINKINGDNCLNLNKVFNYKSFFDSRVDLKVELATETDIKVCPYCNRNYTDTYKINSNRKFTAQLDHFYPKARFPLFALSLANFVPSCSYCNGILKNDNLKTLVYPFNQHNNKKTHFDFEFNDVNSLLGSSNKEIKIKISNLSNFKENSEMFHHEYIYQNHKDHIQRILQQKHHFGDKYYEMMRKTIGVKVPELIHFRELLHGYNPKNENELVTKPLSKLSHDFLNLIYKDKF